jgi:CHAT domain-containing protein
MITKQYRQYRQIVILILSALFGLFSTLSIPAWSNSSAKAPTVPMVKSVDRAVDLFQQGQQRYTAGQLEAAIKLWQESAEAYQKVSDREGVTKSLINQSQALQDLGLYPRACRTLLQSFAVENPDCSQKQLDRLITTLSPQRNSLSATQAIGLRSLGDVLRKQGNFRQSQTVLQLSLSGLQGSPEAGSVLLSLGNTARALGNQVRSGWNYEEITEIIDRKLQKDALAPYQQAFNYYRQAASVTPAPSTAKIQAQLNHFQSLLDIRKWWENQAQQRLESCSRLGDAQLCQRAKEFLTQLEVQLNQDGAALQEQIESQLTTLPPSRTALYTRISFAQSLIQNELTNKIESILDTTLQQARSLKDQRAETYALGCLGKFYEKQEQFSQASKFTQQALMLAQEQNVNGDAREIIYLWQAQLGRLLRRQGDTRGAIASYTAAVNTLQSLRSDLNTNNQDVQFDFLQEVKPIYLELADLLLKSNLNEKDLDSLIKANSSLTKEKTETKPKNNLELARRVIESLQLAELDNFFQDPCSDVADAAVQIDTIDPQAAVIYPIVLPDRLEVLLSSAGTPLQRVSIPVSEKQVNEALDRLYDSLDNLTVNNSARNILATSNPNPKELKDNLQTLLPIFSQVYDWLIQPFEAQLSAKQIKTLVFVLNGRFQRVPIAALYDGKQYLIEKYGLALVPSLQLLNAKQLEGQQLKVLAAGVSEQTQVRGESFTALVNVPKELAQIKATFPASQKLLNQEFTAATIQTQLKSNFSIVHLATHGLFSSNPQKNFIITGDNNSIGINELSTLLREADTSVELLVLSACETATGDERAILGLAGIAVRSGARSTLATLWPVGDASTAEFMGQFYQNLKTTRGKKADALRGSQLSLLESLKRNPPFQELKDLPPHPYYWSPYVLVGNWQ